jgi:hypothetical protein
MPTAVEPVSAGPAATAGSPVRAAAIVIPPAPNRVAAPADVAATPVVPVALTDPATTPAESVLPEITFADETAMPDCTAALQLMPLPGGALSVWLNAPCAAGTRVELRHEGLALAYRTLPSGNLFVTLPALSDKAMVAARLPDGATVIATAQVPDLAGMRRIGVSWGGADAFQLVAGDGPAPALLGDPAVERPMVAAILTLPPGAAAPGFEAAVTPATCGRTMAGSVVVQGGAASTVRDLTLAMPGCDAVGDILVLNNLLPDVTLAAR